jgi:hypothetical protein
MLGAIWRSCREEFGHCIGAIKMLTEAIIIESVKYIQHRTIGEALAKSERK